MQVNKDIIARVGTEGVDSANADLNNFGSTLMGLGKKATVLGMALVAVQKSFKFFTDSISTAKEFEMLQMRLTGLYQSAEKGAEVFDKFKEIAVKTPFNLQEVVQAGAQLKAFGLDAENLLLAVSDLASFMGVDLVTASNAVGRAFAGGVGASEILRERGILQLIKSFQGIEDLTKLTLPQFREALIDTLVNPASDIAGAGQRMMDTYGGAVSNLEDSMMTLKSKIGELFTPALESATRSLTNFLDTLSGSNNIIKQTEEKTLDMKMKFEDLSHTILTLTAKQTKTKEETDKLREAKQKLVAMMPTYITQQQLETSNYFDLVRSIDSARESLYKYSEQLMVNAVISKENEKAMKHFAEMSEVQTAITKIRSYMLATKKDLSDIFPPDFIHKYNILNLLGWERYNPKMLFPSYGDVIDALTKRLENLSNKYSDMKKNVDELRKSAEELYGKLNPPAPETITPKTGATTPTGGTELTEAQKNYQRLLEELKSFQERKDLLNYEGKAKELKELDLWFQERYKIIMGNHKKEEELDAGHRKALAQLREQRSIEENLIIRKYEEQEIEAQRRANEEKLAIQKQFYEQLITIDSKKWLENRLQDIETEKQKYIEAQVEKELINKWANEQIKKAQAEIAQQTNSFYEQMLGISNEAWVKYKISYIDKQRQEYINLQIDKNLIDLWYSEQINDIIEQVTAKEEAEQQKRVDAWREAHKIELAMADSMSSALYTNMNKITRITYSTNNTLINFFIDMANAFIAQVERMIAEWLTFQFFVKGLGWNLSGIVNPFAPAVHAISPRTLTGEIPINQLPNQMATGNIRPEYKYYTTIQTNNNDKELIKEIKNLAEAIKNNPPQIYTQVIKGLPFRTAIEKAQRMTNAL
ncbi:MAG: hypothetical protein RBR14_06500 [Candidatus Cloacimonas acidaminovorans]|nr:hypothetical protein [Candidatus Cloacimonas acidaminovorans]